MNPALSGFLTELARAAARIPEGCPKPTWAYWHTEQMVTVCGKWKVEPNGELLKVHFDTSSWTYGAADAVRMILSGWWTSLLAGWLLKEVPA